MCSAQTVAGMYKDTFIVATPLDDLGILHTLPELPLYGFGNMAGDCQGPGNFRREQLVGEMLHSRAA